jgi:transposase
MRRRRSRRSSGPVAAALRAGRAARHTHDYKRHGVVDLYAALEIATGKVTHRVTETHTATDLLAFMKTVVRRYPERELHVILDNSSTHSTAEVRSWLAANPLVHFDYTPTSASWLNEVERFFGILGKQSLGVPTSIRSGRCATTSMPTCVLGTSRRLRSRGQSRRTRSSSHTVGY